MHMFQTPCYCAALRQAARAISQKYEAALRGTELTVTQFTLLVALSKMERPRVNDLAAALAMDQTTLSRTLQTMQRDGVIEAVDGDDARETRWILTRLGKGRRSRAVSRWKAAQRDVETLLGKAAARRLRAAAFGLATKLAN
jgi:DNA-binding MarR family transcriptional regulator